MNLNAFTQRTIDENKCKLVSPEQIISKTWEAAQTVKPIEWCKHPDEEEYYLILPEIDEHDRGYMVLPSRNGFALFEGFGRGKRKLGQFKKPQDAMVCVKTHLQKMVGELLP